MALEIDEPEILDGSRAWPKTQLLFVAPVDPLSKRWETFCSWYDTSISEYEGAFCVIQSGSDMEALVGRHVQINYNEKDVYLYCVGGAELPTPIAITRRAFMELDALSLDSIEVMVQALEW